jgi:double-stranded uracil-DNA glycosylase
VAMTGSAGQPTRAELLSAYGRTVPDLAGSGMRVLLCGINPSLWSGLVGYHFARPSNRLWPVLHQAGFTPRRLHPSETDELVAAGLGITNLVARATARADELTTAEIQAGLPAVVTLAQRWRPVYVAFLGLSAYRLATGERRAGVGPQERTLGPSGVWLLPNPSGLNASYQMPALVEAYSALREAAYA